MNTKLETVIFNPQNILIIDFGQIGDVILSLPALKAVREKFLAAKITAMIGKSGARLSRFPGLLTNELRLTA